MHCESLCRRQSCQGDVVVSVGVEFSLCPLDVGRQMDWVRTLTLDLDQFQLQPLTQPNHRCAETVDMSSCGCRSKYYFYWWTMYESRRSLKQIIFLPIMYIYYQALEHEMLVTPTYVTQNIVCCFFHWSHQWWFGVIHNGVRRITEAALCWARLVLEWWPCHACLIASVGNLSGSNPPFLSIQPGHLSVCRNIVIPVEYVSWFMLWIFTAESMYASAILGIVILSVRLSLSVTRVLCDETKEHSADILIPHERVITVVFWYQQRLVGDVPFYLKFAFKMTHPLWKKPTSTNICL